MFRDINGLSCVAKEDMDKGMRVSIASTPTGAAFELPYVELTNLWLDDFIGVTTQAVEAGELVGIKMTYGNPIICKISIDELGLNPGTIIGAFDNGVFASNDVAGGCKVGKILDTTSVIPVAGGNVYATVGFQRSSREIA